MRLRVPDYYDKFACSADKCKDSCCVGWEIDIDEDTYEYYKQVDGAFGERLREEISAADEIYFKMKNKRCSFLNEKNLCDICIHLGERALCETCNEYPRFIMEYDDVREKGLSISCEEAGKLILLREECITFNETVLNELGENAGDIGTQLPKFDTQFITKDIEACRTQLLQYIRNQCIQLVQMRSYSLMERIIGLLQYSEKFQKAYDEASEDEIIKLLKYSNTSILDEAKAFIHIKSKQEQYYQAFLKRFEIFFQMEVLDKEWYDTLKRIKKTFVTDTSGMKHYIDAAIQFNKAYEERWYEYEQLLVYFLNRYVIQSIYDDDIIGKVKLSVVSCLMIYDIDLERYLTQGGKYSVEDRVDTARIYSKQVEHAEEMVDYLLEACSCEAGFCTESLMKSFIC